MAQPYNSAGQPIIVYSTSGNPVAFSADASSTFQTLTFQDSNGISFSNNGGAVRLTHALQFTSATSAITSNALHSSASRVINIVAATNSTGGGTASLSSNVSFSAANGITFYTSAGGAVVASHNGLTSQSNQNVTAGNGGFAFQTLSFSNVNGISFGTSAGSAITASHSVPVVSNAIQAVGSATGSGTNTSRFAADDHVHAGVFSLGVSNVGNSAGDTRVSAGQFVLAGGNNITLSQATAAGQVNTISIVGAAGGGGAVVSNAIQSVGSATGSGTNTSRFAADDHVHAGVFSVGVSNLGNTAGDTRVDVGRFVLVGASNITLSQATAANALNTISIRGPVVSNAIASVGSATNSGTNVSRWAADDHVHAGVFSMGVSNVGNTSGDTRVDVGRFVLAGGANVTLSQGTAANALNTITISAADAITRLSAYAVSNTTQSTSGTIPLSVLSFHGAGIASVGVSNGSVIISVPAGGGGGDGGVFAGVSTGGNTAGSTGTVSTGNFVLVGSRNITLSQSTGAAGSAATVTVLGPPSLSGWMPYQNKLMGTALQSNQSLILAPHTLPAAASWDRMVLPFKYTQSTASTMTLSNTIYWGLYTRNADTLSLVYSNSGSFSINGSGTASSSNNSGLRIVSFGDTTGLNPGNYVLGFVWRTSTAGGANMTVHNLVVSQIASTFSGYIGSASVTNRGLYHGQLGVWTSTTAGMPNSVGMTDVRANSSAYQRPPVVYFTSGSV